MEAVLEKRPVTMTGRWSPRLFRLKDRRLMYFKKEVTDFEKAIDSSAKHILDLTHLISLSIDKKHDLVFTLKHPMLDLELRFKTNELFMSWLKVLASFSHTSIRNGPKIETSIPSNYLYAIWNILQSLYSHPSLTKVEGIFRISGNKAERSIIFNNLLQQTYDVQKLQNHSNIHILANVLSALLSNLPSTIFMEAQLGHLVLFYEAISNRNNTKDKDVSVADMFKKQKANNENADHDVAQIPIDRLHKLKDKIEELYFEDDNRSRYGLMTLVFHLLKQIVIHQQRTRMTAENISRIFVHILESKIFLIKCTDPIQMYRMQYLLKTLIYHAYFIFPQQKWDIEDIVIASKGEIAVIYKIYQLRNKRKAKVPLSRPQSMRGGNRKFVSHFKFTEEKDHELPDDDVRSVISATHTEQFDDHKRMPAAPRKSKHTRYKSDTAVLRKIKRPAQFHNDLVVPSTSILPEDTESCMVSVSHIERKQQTLKIIPRKPPVRPLPNCPKSPRSIQDVHQWKRNNNGHKNNAHKNNGHQNNGHTKNKKNNKSNNNSHPAFQFQQMRQNQAQGTSMQNLRRHRAGGIIDHEQKHKKHKKKKKRKEKRTNAMMSKSEIPPPPPPPPPPPALAGKQQPSLYNMMTYNSYKDREREQTIITPSMSCCTLLGCSCTNYIEGIGPFSRGSCMFCNHSIEDHQVKIWM